MATVKRPDGGQLQLTYDGHPLYRYAGDQTRSDANGEGVGGQWFVLKAGGGDQKRSKSSPRAPRAATGISRDSICSKLYRVNAIREAGPLIRSLAREAGVTQKQLAARMGTTQSAIAALERAESNPTMRTVADALDALGYVLTLDATVKPAGVDESRSAGSWS